MVRSTGSPVVVQRRCPRSRPDRAPGAPRPARTSARSPGRAPRPPTRRPRPRHALPLACAGARQRALPGTGHGDLGPARRPPARPARRSTAGPPAPRPSRPRAGRAPPAGPATRPTSTRRRDRSRRSRATRASRSAEPGVRPTRTTPVRPAAARRASGGRLGPRRTTSSRHQSTRTGSPVVVGQGRRRRGTGLRRLPPKAPPLASGDAGTLDRAGTSWRRARRRPAPPRSSAGSAPTRRGRPRPDATAARCCCGPGPAGPGPRRAQARRERRRRRPAGPGRPPAPSRRRSHRRRGPRRRPSSGRPGPRPGPATRPAPGCVRRLPARSMARVDAERAAPAASTIDCHPVQRQRWASRADSTSRRVGRAPRRPASSAARRMTMPGVQKPHWLAPRAHEGGGPAGAQLRGESLEGRHLTARDPTDRRDAGDTGRAVDPDRAAPALALGAAAVLDGAAAELLAQRVEQRDPVCRPRRRRR